MLPNNKPKEVYLNMLLNTEKPFNLKAGMTKHEISLLNTPMRNRKITENMNSKDLNRKKSNNSLNERSMSRDSSLSFERKNRSPMNKTFMLTQKLSIPLTFKKSIKSIKKAKSRSPDEYSLSH